MKSLKTLAFGAALSAFAATAAIAHDHKPNLVEAATEAGVFNTLLAAVQAAGLADALLEAENITVFAPTDEAFAALPEGTVESLLEPENMDQLVAILTYHVLPAKVMSGDLSEGSVTVDTLNADDALEVTVADGVVMADDATVVTADIRISNGVIHVVDSVILPNGE